MIPATSPKQQILKRPLLTALLIVCCVVLMPPGTTVAASPELIEYSLKDQFGNTHSSADVAGRIVLLIGSDGDGADFNDLWGKAIATSLQGRPDYEAIYQLPYADLRSVPFFARGFARGMMPEAPQEWVLLDWKGLLAKHYGFAAGATNVLVFDRNGVLQYQTAGQEPDPAAIEQVAAVLRRLLDE